MMQRAMNDQKNGTIVFSGGAGIGDEHDMLERINLMVSYTAKQSLKRLASYSGITQRAMLEQVLSETEQHMLDTLSGRQQDDYYDGKLSLRSNSKEEISVQKD